MGKALQPVAAGLDAGATNGRMCTRKEAVPLARGKQTRQLSIFDDDVGVATIMNPTHPQLRAVCLDHFNTASPTPSQNKGRCADGCVALLHKQPTTPSLRIHR